MKFVDEVIGCTVSAKDSANVALNASQEAYAYLEAERKGKLRELMDKAVENMEKSGVDTQDAFNQVASRGQYIKGMSRGEKMFYQAAADIKAQEEQIKRPSTRIKPA
jgi:CTP-dependent riboflavin kinase